MKTIRYEMVTWSTNIVIPAVSITKKQFEAFLKGYRQEIKKNHEKHDKHIYDSDGRESDNESWHPDIEETVTDKEKYTITDYTIVDVNAQGSYEAGVCFRKYECKPGYHWI